MPHQFVLYCLSGLISTSVDLACLWLLVRLGMSQLLAVSLAFWLGVLVNAQLHASLTFKRRLGYGHMLRFVVVLGMNYWLTIAVVSLSQTMWGTYWVGKVLSLPLVAIVGFVLSRRWVFKT